MSPLLWCHLGSLDYASGRRLQESLAAERARGDRDDLLLTLEHPPVWTVGRSGRAGAPVRAPSGGRVLAVDRGGRLTYHGPGQLVVYPVVRLRARGRAVRAFVATLEEAVVAAARRFRVSARRRHGAPGVWAAGDRKLASIGLAVRRGVTLHGAAVNVDRRAEQGFAGIAPCGLAGVRATSLEAEGAVPAPGVEAVARAVAEELARRLGRGGVARGEAAGPLVRQSEARAWI